ncbi:MAG: radical SAM protein [Chitinophagales bacterium]
MLIKTKRRDNWFLDDYTINPYSGCSFNCLYCYIRGSKYGIHMEEKLSIKSNALEVLEKQLQNRSKKNQHGIIVLSSATDPYLQFEKETKLTRGILELILQYRFPLHVITKSDLVLRDLDLLKAIGENALLPADLEEKLSHKVFITFSFSTIDDHVAGIFEPGATPPSLRLHTLQAILNAGLASGVNLMPLLPYISDTTEHLELMFSTFSNLGIKYIFPATITLFGNTPSDSKTLVFRAIEKHYPHLMEKYERLFADGTQLPAYYREAFSKKTNTLCAAFGIKNHLS